MFEIVITAKNSFSHEFSQQHRRKREKDYCHLELDDSAKKNDKYWAYSATFFEAASYLEKPVPSMKSKQMKHKKDKANLK